MYAQRWVRSEARGTITSGNGSAACASAEAAGVRTCAMSSAAIIAAMPRFMRGASGGQLLGKAGQARLVAIGGSALDDALGGGAVEDRCGGLVGRRGIGASGGAAHGLDCGTHPGASGNIAASSLLVGDDPLGRGLVMRHENPP